MFDNRNYLPYLTDELVAAFPELPFHQREKRVEQRRINYETWKREFPEEYVFYYADELAWARWRQGEGDTGLSWSGYQAALGAGEFEWRNKED